MRCYTFLCYYFTYQDECLLLSKNKEQRRLAAPLFTTDWLTLLRLPNNKVISKNKEKQSCLPVPLLFTTADWLTDFIEASQQQGQGSSIISIYSHRLIHQLYIGFAATRSYETCVQLVMPRVMETDREERVLFHTSFLNHWPLWDISSCSTATSTHHTGYKLQNMFS